MSADKITALGKELGHALRVRRERAGLNAVELSIRLGWSQSKVSRAEVGARILKNVDLTMYLAACGVDGREINKILDLANEQHAAGHRLKNHTDDLSDECHTLIFHERSATAIDVYDPTTIPDLLQTENYARALLIETGVRRSEIMEHRMKSLADRQVTLRQQQPPQCTFFVHQNALTTPVGDNLVMSEQVLYLVYLNSWQCCTIRVVPREAKGTGLAKNRFQRMTFQDRDAIVRINLETHSLYLENKIDTNRYVESLDRIKHVALTQGDSQTVFRELSDELEGAESIGLSPSP